MSYKSIQRHMANHLHKKPEALVPEVVAALPPEEREKTFIEKFGEIDRYIDDQLREAQATHSPMLVATFVKESRAMLEMRYRLNLERLKLEQARRNNPEVEEAALLVWMRTNAPEVLKRFRDETQAERGGLV